MTTVTESLNIDFICQLKYNFTSPAVKFLNQHVRLKFCLPIATYTISVKER